MKKLNLITLLLIVHQIAFGQLKTTDAVYRRSSLYTLMINEPSRDHADVIRETFVNSPIPEKFNNHLLESRQIENGISANVKESDDKVNLQINNIDEYLRSNNVAKAMVAKWFNRTAKGTFNMNLVAERGSYNATEMDVVVAKSSKRGLAMLADAGEELIANTFVVVNDFDYTNKEEVANNIKQGVSFANKLANKVGKNLNKSEGINKTVTFAGKGYFVKTTSYLYQLVWNDSVAAVFYSEYWMDDNSFDIKKKKAFDNSNIFSLKLIGTEVALADLQATSLTKRSEDELIAIATVRAIDNVIAKLQRKYEVFRTKTPLYKVDPLSAKIGLKEGLEKGDKFEVLEQLMDDEGRTRYKRRGVIKVEDGLIWDNRYMAAEDKQESGEEVTPLEYTTFGGGGGSYYPGMLIRQIN